MLALEKVRVSGVGVLFATKYYFAVLVKSSVFLKKTASTLNIKNEPHIKNNSLEFSMIFYQNGSFYFYNS